MKVLKRSLAIALSTALCVSAVGDSNVFAQGGKKSRDKKGKSSTSRKKPLSEMEKKLSSGENVKLETSKDFEEFVCLMESGKYTTDISISSDYFEDLFCFEDIFKRFLSIIKNSKNIKKMNFRGGRGQLWSSKEMMHLKYEQYKEGVRTLFEAVLSNNFIKDVSLLGFSRIIRPDGFYDVSLERLCLSLIEHSRIICEKVFDSNLTRELKINSGFFEGRPILRDENDLLMSFFRKATSVSHVVFSNIRFKSLSSEIMKVFKSSTSATQLNFNNCDIVDEDVPVLVDILRANSSITKLDLSHNMITSRGKALLDEVIASRPIKCDLILNENSIMTDDKIESLKKKISKTHTVDFSDNIGDDEQFMSIVMDALDKKLFDRIIIGEERTFADCEMPFVSRIADEDLDVKSIVCKDYDCYESIAQIINSSTHVQEIIFSNANLQDDEVFCIADALKNNSTVKRLNLSKNEISDDGAKALLEALRENDTLTEIDLSNNTLGDYGDRKVEKISGATCNSIRERLALNKYRDDLRAPGVSPSGGEMKTYISTVRRLYENIKRLKSGSVDLYPTVESITKDVHELIDLHNVLDENSRKYLRQYKYYEAAMKYLEDVYKNEGIDKRYVAKIYDDISKEFNEYNCEYMTFLNDLKFIKVDLDDIMHELGDINTVGGFFGYVNYFGYIRSFIDYLFQFKIGQNPDLKIEGIPTISSDEFFTEEDNAKIAKLKEQWSETWKVQACANIFCGCSNFMHKHYDAFLKKLRPDVSAKYLYRKDQEIWLWFYRIYLPLLEEAKEKKVYFSSAERARVDRESVYAKNAIDFSRRPENQSVDIIESYLRDIDLAYDFAKRVRVFDDVDMYLSFLKQWDAYEKNDQLKPLLKLSMMVSNLNTFKEYISEIKENCAELEGEAVSVERNIDFSLELFKKLFMDKDETQLSEALEPNGKWFNTESTRRVISELLLKYKNIKEKSRVEVVAVEKEAEKEAGADVVPAERVNPKKSKKKQKQQAKKSCVVERVPTEEEILMRTKREFENIRESLISKKTTFDMLSEKHAQFLARGYLRVNKMGQAEEFAKKENISKKLSDIRELFSDAEKFSVGNDADTMKAQLEFLKRVSSAISDKLRDVDTLLSTAENFMSKKFEVPKVSSPVSEQDQGEQKPSSEESEKIAEFTIKYRSAEAEKEYKSLISEDKEKIFFEKFRKHIRGQLSPDLEKITGVNYSFISCRYSLAGRICFTYDPDENCIEIIGVMDDHNYDMIKRRLSGCKA